MRQVRVREVGTDAAAAIAGSAAGRVAAVFPRALYVETEAGWFCMGPPALGSGPLNVICDTGAETAWANQAMRTGVPVQLSVDAVSIGSRLILALRGARTWQPATPPPWSADTLGMGIQALDACPGLPNPAAGLGRFMRPSPRPISAEALKAAPAIDHLRVWLEGDAIELGALPEAVEKAAVSLLGLGPGLTPAGDDFLGGLMIGLALTGRNDLRRRLWQGLAPHVDARTVAISGAHLRAAAAGRGGETMHAAVHALMAGRAEDLTGILTRIGRIGHTSGWDAFAGAVTALRSIVTKEHRP